MSIAITKISTFEQFARLSQDWDALQARAQLDNIFLTHDWLNAWWRFFGQGADLWVLTGRDNKQLVGIAPLMRQRSPGGGRVLSFMGTGDVVPNHLEFIVLPAERKNFIEAVCTFLWQTRSEWDILDLTALPDDSPTRDLVTAGLQNSGISTHSQYDAPCPYTVLPDSFEAYLQTRGEDVRGQFRSKRRRLLRKHPEARFGRVETPDEVEGVFSALVRLHQAHWQKLGHTGSFASQPLIEFYLSAAQNALQSGRLRLYYLQIDSDYAAVYYCFRIGYRMMYYSSGFDDRWRKFSIGIQLLAYALEQSIAEGAAEFDFLQGDEVYKLDWATHTRGNWRLQAASPHLRGQMIWAMRRSIATGRTAGRAIMPPTVRQALKRYLGLLKRRGRT
ncbi:MAG: GNAT family N-acetyltransferase [Chloroflexota bacterium]